MATIERDLKTSTNEDLYESFKIIDTDTGDPFELVAGWFTAETLDGTQLFSTACIQDVEGWITCLVPQSVMGNIPIPAGRTSVVGRYDIAMEFTGPRRSRIQRGRIMIEAGVTVWP